MLIQDQAYVFQDTYFISSQIHQLTIMHRFEDKNHDILLFFLFQNFRKLFLRMYNLYR